MTETSRRLCSFVAGEQGPWLIQRSTAVVGRALPNAARLTVIGHTDAPLGGEHAWYLQGIASHDRYVTRDEKIALVARQPELGRPSATCAAFIALRKNSQWWGLTQDERRQVVEEQSQHIATGMRYLPAIARRLYHCRDLTTTQPFDFLTWFEYASGDAATFDELLASLRASAEWRFIEREVDIRLTRVVES